MKIEVKENEAFIKVSVDKKNEVHVSYGFNMTSPSSLDTQEKKQRSSTLFSAVCLLSGAVITMKNHSDDLMDIGETAIEMGDVDIQTILDSEKGSFLEGLSDEQVELFITPVDSMQ
mgnify:CR=1 FL=1|tara:strand:- start:632 stop:979 length:348 start_codon:yes stop_codon:yes gene_type:complete